MIVGQRQARHDFRGLRAVRTERRVALVLVGRRAGSPPGGAVRAGRPPRAPASRPSSTEASSSTTRRRRSATGRSKTFGGFNQPLLCEGVRAPAAVAGQLPLAGDVGQRLQRRRPAESGARRRVRHRPGHVAPRADDACARRVATLRHGALELRHQWRSASDVLDGRHSTDRGLREHHHARHARRRRRADVGSRPTSPCSSGSSPISAGSSREHPNAAMSPSCRRCGRSTRKCRSTTSSGMRVPDDVTLLWSRRQLGEYPPPAHAGGTQSKRRRRCLLPLRLCGRAAVVQVAQHRAHPEDLGTDAFGLALRRHADLGGERRRHQTDGAADPVLSGLRLGSRALACRPAWRVHARLGRARVRRRPCGGDCDARRRATRNTTDVASRRCWTPQTYSLGELPGSGDTSWTISSALVARAETIHAALSCAAQGCVLPARAAPDQGISVLNELYVTAGMNQLYAAQGRDGDQRSGGARARDCSREDAELTRHYNETLAGGKWQHMMDQTHIGYTYWNQPARNAMPAVQEIQPSANRRNGRRHRGFQRELAWRRRGTPPVLPALDGVREGSAVYRDLQPRP